MRPKKKEGEPSTGREGAKARVDLYRASFNLATVLANIVAAEPSSSSSRTRLDDAAEALNRVFGLRDEVTKRRDAAPGANNAPDAPRIRSPGAKATGRTNGVGSNDDLLTGYWDLVRRPAILLAAGILKLHPDPTSAQCSVMSEAALTALPPELSAGHRESAVGSVTPVQLLKLVKAEGPLDGRSHYNVACLLVAVGEHDDEAMRHLARGCSGSPSRTRWAASDPSLTALQQHRPNEWAQLFPAPPSKSEPENRKSPSEGPRSSRGATPSLGRGMIRGWLRRRTVRPRSS